MAIDKLIDKPNKAKQNGKNAKEKKTKEKGKEKKPAAVAAATTEAGKRITEIKKERAKEAEEETEEEAEEEIEQAVPLEMTASMPAPASRPRGLETSVGSAPETVSERAGGEEKKEEKKEVNYQVVSRDYTEVVRRAPQVDATAAALRRAAPTGTGRLANAREIDEGEANRILGQGIPVYRPTQKENPWAVNREYEFKTRDELVKEKRSGVGKNLPDYHPREVAEF